MMNLLLGQSNSQSVTRWVFDGALSPTTAIAIGVALMVLMGTILWVERSVIGRVWTIVFGLLRLVALLAVSWMLLQPSQVSEQTITQKRSIAILADRSESMNTIDQTLTAEMLPWVESGDSAMTAIDQAAIDLRFAAAIVRVNWLESATLSSAAKSPLLERLDFALQRCLLHLKAINTESTSLDRALANRLQGIHDEVRGVQADRKQLDDAASKPDGDTSLSTKNGSQRVADRLVETLEQQAADLDAIIHTLQRERLANPPSFTGRSRKDFVGDWLKGWETGILNDLAKTTQIRRAVFDSSVQTLIGTDWESGLTGPAIVDETTSENARTDLAAAIAWSQPTVASDRLAAVFLVSEGGHNATGTLSPVAAARSLGGVPVVAVGIGNAMRSRDAVLHQLTAPRVVAVGDDIKIEAIVSAYDCVDVSAEVVLREGDKEIERRSIQIESVVSDTRLEFRVPADELRTREFDLAILPIEGEVSEKNNVSSLSVETVVGKTRLLLADSESRWEYRYLQLLFARDSRVEADEYLVKPHSHATGAVSALGGSLPTTVEDWAMYDIVILGDLELSEASESSLQDYVSQRAGKVIFIAGKNSMPEAYLNRPLFDLLPIQPTPHPSPTIAPLIALTRDGQLHPAMQIESNAIQSKRQWAVTSSRVPLGYVSPFSVPRDSSRVLARIVDANSEFELSNETLNEVPSSFEPFANAQAWLCWHRVGSGHVVYLSSPSAYKLRFRSGDTRHHRFWGQMLRWLMASDVAADQQLVQLKTDKSNYAFGDTIQVVAQLRGADGLLVSGGEVSVQIRGSESESNAASGLSRTIDLLEDVGLPGTYRTELRDLTPDQYQFEPVGPYVDQVRSDELVDRVSPPIRITVEQLGDIERVLTTSNLPFLAEISSATGGYLLTPSAAEEMMALLPLDEEVTTIQERTPIWNRWSMLWLVAGCLSTEWIIRKTKGLI
ncbi:hypothetical protein Poly51_36000 [Rubripirellula tenax]|uniref:VWFA domain-containing protein n=1 Tax=Rubripirellula tenax TaxID=2528015 RepID=A0A5C6F0G3_9BACT|nr:hypothetical protein [Rubripirellula tenax]TWU54878.1 hypothetical protein Poly51_36000 [Rubripirellula tenax]